MKGRKSAQITMENVLFMSSLQITPPASGSREGHRKGRILGGRELCSAGAL